MSRPEFEPSAELNQPGTFWTTLSLQSYRAAASDLKLLAQSYFLKTENTMALTIGT